jgi:hypothetical protein
MMNRALSPCAVVMTMRDGTVTEQLFPTRFQAELFLYLLPMLMMTQPHEEGVASAILSPLVEERAYQPAAAPAVLRPYRINQYPQ